MIYLYEGDFTEIFNKQDITVESFNKNETAFFKVEYGDRAFIINDKYRFDLSNLEVVFIDKLTTKDDNFVTEYTVDNSKLRLEIFVSNDGSSITLLEDDKVVEKFDNIGDINHFGILEVEDTSVDYDYKTKLHLTEGNDALFKAFDLLRKCTY